MRYPNPFQKGMTIGVTGPSGGVHPRFHPRLDLALNHLRQLGYRVQEGTCLRDEHKHASGPKEERAVDLMRLWADEGVHMVFPPWGGSLAMEVLPLIDFDVIRRTPKWIQGYSDISTLLFAITLNSDVATAHGPNLMDTIPAQRDPLTFGHLDRLGTLPGESFEQHSSVCWQRAWTNLATEPERGFYLTEPTRWRTLDDSDGPVVFSGRLIGGCLDSLTSLPGTPFGDLASFARRYRSDGIILYLENVAESPTAVARRLWTFRMAGWMDDVKGIVLGRSAAPDVTDADALSYIEALEASLGDLDVPIVFDADIGHRPPQMTLINGAMGRVTVEAGHANVKQALV